MASKLTAEAVTQYMNDHQIVAGCESAVNLAVAKQSDKPLADVGFALLAGEATADPPRPLSLPKQVAAAGGITKWNEHPTLAQQIKMLDAACTATTVAEALTEVRGIMSLGHNLWAYSYLRKLYAKNANVYYGTLAADPALLLPVSQPGPRAGLIFPGALVPRLCRSTGRWRTRRRWARRASGTARSSATCAAGVVFGSRSRSRSRCSTPRAPQPPWQRR